MTEAERQARAEASVPSPSMDAYDERDRTIRRLAAAVIVVVVGVCLLSAALYLSKTSEANAERRANAQTRSLLISQDEASRCRGELVNRDEVADAVSERRLGELLTGIVDFLTQQRPDIPPTGALDGALDVQDATTRARVVAGVLCDDPEVRAFVLGQANHVAADVSIPDPLDLVDVSTTTSTTLEATP